MCVYVRIVFQRYKIVAYTREVYSRDQNNSLYTLRPLHDDDELMSKNRDTLVDHRRYEVYGV